MQLSIIFSWWLTVCLSNLTSVLYKALCVGICLVEFMAISRCLVCCRVSLFSAFFFFNHLGPGVSRLSWGLTQQEAGVAEWQHISHEFFIILFICFRSERSWLFITSDSIFDDINKPTFTATVKSVKQRSGGKKTCRIHLKWNRQRSTWRRSSQVVLLTSVVDGDDLQPETRHPWPQSHS